MRYQFITRTDRERPLRFVPLPVFLLLLIFFSAQLALSQHLPRPQVVAKDLPEVPQPHILQLATLGDRLVLSKYLMLWLQAFDNQPGISLPFSQLDYHTLREWLDTILKLDPQSQYPLLSASRVYGEITDKEKKQIMLSFVQEKFREDPALRWQWMAHAVYIAKHHLKDLEMALAMAREIREKVPMHEIPAWARQMEIYILEDMNELESAKVLVGGLLESGKITDENELRYLELKLEELQNKP